MNDIWLADEDYLNGLISAKNLLINHGKIASEEIPLLVEPSLAIIKNNGAAIIPINGAMVDQLTSVDRLLNLYLGIPLPITYQAISGALTAAANDTGIKEIKIMLKSPGGKVSGFMDLVAVMKSINKPIITHINDYAYSAAYFLATQTDKIILDNNLASVGSVGVLVVYSQPGDDKNTLIIRSSNAPDKNLPISNEKERLAVQERLNYIEHNLMELAAQGRGKKLEEVQQNFGRGGIVSAEHALSAGMIDKIIELPNKRDNTVLTKSIEESIMEKEEQEALIAKERARSAELISLLPKLPKTSAAQDLIQMAISTGKSKADIMDDVLELMAVSKVKEEEMQQGVQAPPIVKPAEGDEFMQVKAEEAEEKAYEEYLKALSGGKEKHE